MMDNTAWAALRFAYAFQTKKSTVINRIAVSRVVVSPMRLRYESWVRLMSKICRRRSCNIRNATLGYVR
jgi:hypothetical protein